MVYCRYSYAALSVQGCCTLGAKLLHSSGTDQNCLKSCLTVITYNI